MESIIERVNQHKFWSFHGGIHPPEQKTLTSSKPIRQLPLPKQLILPLQQHIGRQGDLLVKVGDKVLKGQALTQSSNPMAVPIHAPTSGIISAIKKSAIAHPSGLSELCIFIDVDFEDTWQARKICQDFTKLSSQDIIKKIADSGIAGMGGAGFPTHIKVNTKPDINFLIINAAECEPYITADDLLMCEQSEAIVDGIKILDQLLNPAFILIGIEDNKPRAIKALQHATRNIEKIKVCVLPTKYPTGGEKQLVKILTGIEIKSGTLPIHSSIVVQNVATCFAISDAVINDIPLIKRVVTVTGQALNKPQNVWALLGTPVSHLLEQADFISEESNSVSNPPVIMGGPLMGFSILNELVPIVKTSNCILAPSKTEMPSAFDNSSKEVECIRCGQCADVCPSQLLPQEMQWSAKAKDHQQLTKLHLFDCIDCGACAYVCPSQIPLVQYYRVAKAEIRQQQQLDIKSEKAKVRFEARKLRLEKEKIAREEKHKKAAAARKATMNKKSSDGGTASSAVAAALARVKAKKLASQKGSESPVNDDKVNEENALAANTSDVSDEKSEVKAAIARAKAKRLAKNKPSESPVSDDEVKVEEIVPAVTSDVSDEKSEVKAAIAMAKAKRLAKNKPSEPPVSDDKVGVEVEIAPATTNDIPDEKSEVKAAIARAKAKRLVKNKPSEPPVSDDKVGVEVEIAPAATNDIPDEKSEVKAAIVKAKAKKRAKNKADEITTTNNEEPDKTVKTSSLHDKEDDTISQSPAPVVKGEVEKVEKPTNAADDKKAKIAAAVAKAKAKARAKAKAKNDDIQEEPLTTSSDNSSKAATEVDDKKTRIAAAIAKAKMKAKAKNEQAKQLKSTIKESE